MDIGGGGRGRILNVTIQVSLYKNQIRQVKREAPTSCSLVAIS